MSVEDDTQKRQAQRVPLLADVDLEIDSKIITAMTVDVSETGVRIDTLPALKISLRFVVDGELQDRTAQLVWCRPTPEGGMSYGLKYISDTETPKEPEEVLAGKT